jgi:hypothetical protein
MTTTETLETYETPGQAMGIAAKMTALALEAGQVEAARLIYVTETDAGYVVVASDETPAGRVIWNGPEEVAQMISLRKAQR